MLPIDPRCFKAILTAFAVTVASVTAVNASFSPTSELTSNSIIALAGSADTIWAATDQGFNFSLNSGFEWGGFSVSDLGSRLYGMAFGGGFFGAALWSGNVYDHAKMWIYNHKDRDHRHISIRWPEGWLTAVSKNAQLQTFPRSVVYLSNDFWVACGDGGLVRLSASGQMVRGLQPGKNGSEAINDFLPDTSHTTRSKVLTVSAFLDQTDTSLLVVTPSKIWLLDPSAETWDSSSVTVNLSRGHEFVSFRSAAGHLRSDGRVIYALINRKVPGSDNETVGFYRYSQSTGNWSSVLSAEPDFVSVAADQFFYTVTDENRITLFRDTVSADHDLEQVVPSYTADNVYRTQISTVSADLYPSTVADILFIPYNDSTGQLVIATSSGVYLSDSLSLADRSAPDFRLMQHVRKVRDGETYALPGIIRSSPDGRYDRAVFVYSLGGDASVDINVYDYNMSLVKTVVSGSQRVSGTLSGRSTNPARDWWDGTDRSGRAVAPGVYYFKISSSKGERFFGKVIVAK